MLASTDNSPTPESKFFQHDRALVESCRIGEGTRIWAMAHILPGATIGRYCNICDHTFIENNVVLGDRVTVKCGVQLWDGVVLEDDVFIGPNATFTNDSFPRSKNYPKVFAQTIVKRGASIGANATVLPGLIIGERAMVGAGAVVTRNVPPLAIVAGNPARIVGYDGALEDRKSSIVSPPDTASVQKTRVGRVTLHRLPSALDMRGRLSYAEFGEHLPFEIKRFFLVYDVPSKEVRGEHAHRTLHQFLVCTHGSCAVMADDGINREEFLMNNPTIGVYLPPLIWGVQYKYSTDAVLLVLASDYYNSGDYIRDYSEFLGLIKSNIDDFVK